MSASRGASAHAKGNSRERLVAKLLTKWTGERVMRTLSSGAGGTRAVDEIRMTGDLFFPLGSKNPFSYEIKDHATTKLKQVFNNNGDIPDFFEQAVTDCRRVEKYGFNPMLIFHISRETDYVLTMYNDSLYIDLFKNNLKFSTQWTSFEEKRLNTINKCHTILTTLPELMKLNYLDVFSYYSDDNYSWEDQIVKDKIKDNSIEKTFDNIDSLLKADKEGKL